MVGGREEREERIEVSKLTVLDCDDCDTIGSYDFLGGIRHDIGTVSV